MYTPTEKNKKKQRTSVASNFPPELCSVHDNNQNNFPKTTNQAETWHRLWFALIGAAHVGTHFLVNEMIKEEHKVIGDIERMVAGFAAPKKKKTSLRKKNEFT